MEKKDSNEETRLNSPQPSSGGSSPQPSDDSLPTSPTSGFKTKKTRSLRKTKTSDQKEDEDVRYFK